MKEVTREEFESLVKQVRSLERQVDAQQKQIATLKRRTTTDVGSPSGASSSEETDTGTVEVPRSRIELDVMEILRDESADEQPIEVNTVKNEAAQLGHLRSGAKSVLRKWLQNGYLTGDVEDEVQVAEWPPETKTAGE